MTRTFVMFYTLN